jgi:hypothetical protein
MTEKQYDAYDDAMKEMPARFWGKVTVEAYKCVLVPGQGKVPYDPTVHAGERTSTAIEFTVEPLDTTRPFIKRETLNWTISFRRVVRPSIEELVETIAELKSLEVGQFNPLKKLNGMWVQGAYVEQPENKDGENWTTLRFDKVFLTEDECAADYTEVTGQSPSTGASPVEDLSFMPDPVEPLPKEEPKPQVDPERATFANFLPSLWAQANGDVAEMERLLVENPMLAKHFDVDSPEVKAIIGQ